jgi:hypothetical protein
MLTRLVVTSSLVFGGYLNFGAPSQAHSWYPTSCCSGQDCEMVPSGGIDEVSNGYRVRYVSDKFGTIDEVVPSSYVRSSQDVNFHACWRKSNVTPKIICFFAPLNV